MENIYLKEVSRNSDGDVSYRIMLGEEEVGSFLTIEDDRDFIFGRQITVHKEYGRMGIATRVINDFVNNHSKPMRFTIALNSHKAISFWKKYLDSTSFKKTELKKDSWQLEKTT